MTGFGSARAQVESEEISVEIRSVNGKFCEVKARFPRELQAFEGEVVRRIKERLARGTVDLFVRRSPVEGQSLREPRVDEALADRVAREFRELRDRLGLEGDVRLADVISVPGVVVVEEVPPDPERAGQAMHLALDQALDHLVAMREREGEALRADLEARLRLVEGHAAQLARAAPEAVREQHERILQRVEELAGSVTLDPQRLAQEVAILADRSDVAEELTRIESHVKQFRRLMDAPDPAGRRLDFLVQELNREANTTASKASWTGAAEITVELKAEIERIREQVQNVE
ncbi:MAG TPA: YicC/YloC family endoribonuclease [Vulgatibacter sp.]|nr:YicC/YloC family endoribonuclease [Vulgatibacter sp.]